MMLFSSFKFTRSLMFLTFVVLVAMLSSCNSRQARIIGKIAREIEHASEDDYEVEPAKPENISYSISGIMQYDDGGVVRLEQGASVEQDKDGLYIKWFTSGNLNNYQRCTVYKNDIVTITETYYLPDDPNYKFSFGETATRPYDVSMYSYVCPMPTRTFYFNIVN